MLKRFLRGAFLLSLTSILVRLSGVLVLVPLARLLTQEQFGFYSLILWIVQSMCMVGRLGIDVAMHRNGAQLYQTQPLATGRLLGVGSLLMTGSFVVISASLWLWRFPLATLWLKAPTVEMWLGFAAIITLTEGIVVVFSTGLLSLHDFKSQSLTATVGAFSKLILSPFLAWQYGLLGALLGFLIASTVQALLSTLSFYQAIRSHSIPINFQKFGQESKQILHFGFPFYTGNALIALITLPIMGELGHIAGVEVLAQIRIGQALSQPIGFLASAVAPVTISVLSEAYTKDSKEFQQLRSFHLRSNWLMSLTLVTFLSLASQPLVVLVFGQTYSSAVPAVVGMAWIAFIAMLTENLNLYSLAAGRTDVIAAGSITQKILFVGITFWLLPRIGLLGYIAGHLAGYIVQALVLSIILWRGVESKLRIQCYVLFAITLTSLCLSYSVYHLALSLWLNIILSILISGFIAGLGLKSIYNSELNSSRQALLKGIKHIRSKV